MLNHSGLSPRHLLNEPRCMAAVYGSNTRRDDTPTEAPAPVDPHTAHSYAMAAYASARKLLGKANRAPASIRRAEQADALRFLARTRRELHRAADALAQADAPRREVLDAAVRRLHERAEMSRKAGVDAAAFARAAYGRAA